MDGTCCTFLWAAIVKTFRWCLVTEAFGCVTSGTLNSRCSRLLHDILSVLSAAAVGAHVCITPAPKCSQIYRKTLACCLTQHRVIVRAVLAL